MTQYLLSVHNDGTSPYASEEEMQAAFADDRRLQRGAPGRPGCGCSPAGSMPPSTAKVLRRRDGAIERTDGPYLESKEHIGGFWIIEAADEAEALEWAARGAIACRGDVEVRPVPGHRLGPGGAHARRPGRP